MSITYPIYQKASFYPEKYGRETFLADAGQRSRAIIPGDDPGDQQPPERRSLYPDPVGGRHHMPTPSCDNLRIIGNSRLVKLTTIFPFVGYLIVFNEHVVSALHLEHSLLEE